MKLDKKNKSILLLALGMLFILSAISINNLDLAGRISSYRSPINDNNEKLKSSKISGKIYINGNSGWVIANNTGICTGNGTYSEPYIIEDLEIDAGGSGSCILIENSDVFFKIINCTVYNATGSWGYAGIKLNNVENGHLKDNNCSSNNFLGIDLSSCSNNNISGNIITKNNNSGLHMSNCNDIIISGNTVNNNGGIGMYLDICEKIEVRDNFINENGWVGMWLDAFNNSTVSGNSVCHNAEMGGISLGSSDRNIISDNIVSYNDYSGIHGSGNFNEITNNTANYNKDSGIGLNHLNSGYGIITDNNVNHNGLNGIYLNGDGFNVTGNTAYYNDEYGIMLDGGASNCTLYLNYLSDNLYSSATDEGTNNHWDNGTIGNYWGDYSGKDVDDDGIGDTPYNISGAAGSQDTYPIWWDDPVVRIISPVPNSIHGSVAPTFTLEIEGVPVAMWYEIEGISGTFSITELIGNIDQDTWNNLTEGEVKIWFFIQDSRDILRAISVLIVKKISSGAISGYNLIFLVGILSAVVAIIINKKIKKS